MKSSFSPTSRFFFLFRLVLSLFLFVSLFLPLSRMFPRCHSLFSYDLVLSTCPSLCLPTPSRIARRENFAPLFCSLPPLLIYLSSTIRRELTAVREVSRCKNKYTRSRTETSLSPWKGVFCGDGRRTRVTAVTRLDRKYGSFVSMNCTNIHS